VIQIERRRADHHSPSTQLGEPVAPRPPPRHRSGRDHTPGPGRRRDRPVPRRRVSRPWCLPACCRRRRAGAPRGRRRSPLCTPRSTISSGRRWVPRTGPGTWPVRFPHPDDRATTADTWRRASRARRDMRPNLRSRRPRPAHAVPALRRRGRRRAHPDPRVVAPRRATAARPVRRGRRRVLRPAVPRGRARHRPRPVVTATGDAGDLFLCHPFLVHAAQVHRGAQPRFMAQPPLEPTGRRTGVRDAL